MEQAETSDDGTHPARFDRLRAYCRNGRAPWRREGGRLIFISTRDADGAPDIRLSPASFADALRQRFSAEHAQEATEGLASRSPDDSAKRVLTDAQRTAVGLAALLVIGLAAAAPEFASAAFFAAVAALFTIMIGVRLALAAIAATPRRPHPRSEIVDADLPVITILVPLFREASALAGLAAALDRLDYPRAKLDIKLLLEANDHATIAEARRLNAGDAYDLVIIPPSSPQTKPKALNYALPTARGGLVVIYDAEDEPEPRQLRIAAETFAAAPDDLACVQARLTFYNCNENWLTRLFTLEYHLWFDHFLPALDRIGAPVPLGGTSNVFRMEALTDAGCWDAHNVTEDADLGLRLARRGWRTAIIESTTYEEANCALPNWIRQRSRWMKGFMQTWLVQRRRAPAFADWKSVLAVDLFIGGTVVAALAAPLLWAASIAEVFAGASASDFLPAPAGDVAVASLTLGNIALVALAAIAPLTRGMARLSPWALFMPVYWMLMAWAAYLAVWQLATRPHFWEKTDHGLSAGAETRRRNALKSLGFD